MAGRRLSGAGALVVIGGSTASGKSALALALARATGGIVVNADAQQLFADLPILTARPGPADTAMAEHALYGVLDAAEQPSLGRWLALVEPVLGAARARGRTMIVTGGTGLYLKGLLVGVPPRPAIPPELRAELRHWAAARPTAEIHARLAAADPVMARRLDPRDRQRQLRALEVVAATGRSLAAWAALPPQPLALPARIVGVALVPPPEIVNPRIAARLEAMLAAGAAAEVAALLARRPDALTLPIAKVHGCRELAAMLAGTSAPAAALARIAAQIRQYAKRQRTWFRHQLPQLETITAAGDDRQAERIVARLDRDP